MALVKSGFRTLDHIGTVDASVAGSNRKIHGYITNDDAATVETSDYFLSLYERLTVGDILICSLDLDGTRTVRMYVFDTVTSSGVTIKRETTAVTGDQTFLAALTEDSGAIGGTNDGDLPDLSGSPAGTDAAIITALIAAVRELADRNNALRAALVASGLMAAS